MGKVTGFFPFRRGLNYFGGMSASMRYRYNYIRENPERTRHSKYTGVFMKCVRQAKIIFKNSKKIQYMYLVFLSKILHYDHNPACLPAWVLWHHIATIDYLNALSPPPADKYVERIERIDHVLKLHTQQHLLILMCGGVRNS